MVLHHQHRRPQPWLSPVISMVGSDRRTEPPQNDVAGKPITSDHHCLNPSHPSSPQCRAHHRSVKAASRRQSQQPPKVSAPPPSLTSVPSSRSGMDLTVDHHNDDEQHFLPKPDLAVDSSEAVTIIVVAGRHLDRMIQVAYLTGDASPCRPLTTAVTIDIACCRPRSPPPDACHWTAPYHDFTR
ncbi:hypothetical protein ACLOJK_023181 [Asimina triloba]